MRLSPVFAGDSYDLVFSTYFGGSQWEHARDVAADKDGSIYVVGGTASANFLTTPGAYSRTIQAGGSQGFGPCDVFVVKFAPDGRPTGTYGIKHTTARPLAATKSTIAERNERTRKKGGRPRTRLGPFLSY